MDLETVTQTKSETEKQMSDINAYTWNLETWYGWTYLQSRNRDADVKNKCMGTEGGRGEWEKLGDWDRLIHTAYKIGN